MASLQTSASHFLSPSLFLFHSPYFSMYSLTLIRSLFLTPPLSLSLSHCPSLLSCRSHTLYSRIKRLNVFLSHTHTHTHTHTHMSTHTLTCQCVSLRIST